MIKREDFERELEIFVTEFVNSSNLDAGNKESELEALKLIDNAYLRSGLLRRDDMV